VIPLSLKTSFVYLEPDVVSDLCRVGLCAPVTVAGSPHMIRSVWSCGKAVRFVFNNFNLLLGRVRGKPAVPSPYPASSSITPHKPNTTLAVLS
jgi:hypothetical protein